MRVFTNSEKYKANILLNHELVSTPQQADCLVLTRDADPIKYLCGIPAIIDVGEYDSEAEDIIIQAANLGIPEEYILVCADGGCIEYEEIEQIILGITVTKRHEQPSVEVAEIKPQNHEDLWSSLTLNQETDETPERINMPVPEIEEPSKSSNTSALWTLARTTNKPRKNTISIIGFKGGQGRSLISTGLSAIYSGFGEKVAVVDLGKPAFARFYMGIPNLVEKPFGYFAQTKWGDIFIPKSRMKGELMHYLEGYKRIIYDLPSFIPPEYREEVFSSNKILVVDHDMRTLEVTKEKLNLYQLPDINIIINKVPIVSLGTYSYVVGSELETMPIMEIPYDEQCSAFIDNYSPVVAESGSSAIALKIAELATILNNEGEGSHNYAQGL